MAARRRSGRRGAGFEPLEERALLSSLPYGAAPDDTAEYMLGDVLVTVVLMESNTTKSSINPNTETWTSSAIAAVKQKVADGVNWWKDTLVNEFPNATHPLSFQFDYTYADSPVLTRYEPIANKSDAFQNWIYDFLDQVGYNTTGDFSQDIRAFNNAERLTHSTDWAFTVFVVSDANDGDHCFKSGGSFSRAFSYAGGQLVVSPASRPASTFAHETGHIFWARDEYSGSGAAYTDHRGYYNTQNTNAIDGAPAGFVQSPSIMTSYTLLDTAYAGHVSSQPSLEAIGWRDSDGDGIFDVLDQPFTLTGVGGLDPQSGDFLFRGSSSVQTLPNLNSSGLQNDITINRIRLSEYRIDGGVWETAATYDASMAVLDLRIPLPDAGRHRVEIRTRDDVTGVTSPVFEGDTSQPASVAVSGVNGVVWEDTDGDGTLDNGESGHSGWTVRLVDAAGQPLNLVSVVEPDAYSTGYQFTTVQPGGVTLQSIGELANGRVAVSTQPSHVANKVFCNYQLFQSNATPLWTASSRMLRLDFATPVSAVRLDAIGYTGSDYGRLEIFDSSGRLLERYTTGGLGPGQVETMALQRPTADIAYAIARAHSDTELDSSTPDTTGLMFDNLRVGPETQVPTDAQGAYAITSLPAGTYYVEAVSPSGWPSVAPRQTAVLSTAGATVAGVDLVGQLPSWRNPVLAADVSGDGFVFPVDALLVINHLNGHASGAVPDGTPGEAPFLDVDGNGVITASDVLAVINWLNGSVAAPGGAGMLSGEAAGEGGGAPVTSGTALREASPTTASKVAPAFAPAVLPATTRSATPIVKRAAAASAEFDDLLGKLAADVMQVRDGAVTG